MQLINAPAKLVLPFANAGAKNTIPTASQIGIVAGAASLTDGFPPLTRTPLAAGGVPPSGLDMNGILYELSAVIRWANAGGGYPYDASFATDTNIQGYPKGARVLRSDGTGYWFNTADGNTTDPEGAGAIAAGWVPDFTTGAAAVTMTSANVTLTAAQYGKPIIVITGLLTANLNLIFPSIVGEWIVINSTTGPYTITCKTAAGTGVVVNSVQALAGDATNIYSTVNDAISSMGELIASAGGTADALTATFSPAPRMWPNGVPFLVRAASANATTTPTFTANSGTLAAKTIVKGANAALVAGDIAGAGHWLLMQYDVTLDKVVLLNPATGLLAASSIQVPVRQTVLGGPVDTNGLPVFLPATSVNLNITSQNISTGVNALVATAAGGANANGAINAVGQAVANLTWTGCTANQTNYLPVSISGGVLTALTPVILQPIIQQGGTPAVTNGQYTYNIQQGVMYLGNGSAANPVNHVIVGEAVAGASSITSTVAYAYLGRYDSGLFAVSSNNNYSKNHNLGLINVTFEVNFSEDAVGTNERKAMPLTFTSSNFGYLPQTASRNSIAVTIGPGVNHNTAGSVVNSGYYRFKVSRGW